MSKAPLKYVKGDKRRYAGEVPPERQQFADLMKTCFANFWHVNEIKDLVPCREDYKNSSPEVKHFFEILVSMFSQLDAIINEAISSNVPDIEAYDIVNLYKLIETVEVVHQQAYSLQLETIIDDKEVARKLRDSIQYLDSIKELVQWIKKNTEKDDSPTNFAKRIFINMLIEGVIFAGAFAGIDYLLDNNIMVALGVINNWIARDENTHVLMGYYVYSEILDDCKLSTKEVHKLTKEVIAIAEKINGDLCPSPMDAMNKTLLTQYSKYMSDILLEKLGYLTVYNVKNPFSFTEKNRWDKIVNNFERVNTQYESNSSFEEINYQKYL